MHDCPECDAPNRAKNRSCHNCGAALPAQRQAARPQPSVASLDLPPAVTDRHPELARAPGESDEAYIARCRAWLKGQVERLRERMRLDRAAADCVPAPAPELVDERHRRDMDALERAGYDVSGAYRRGER